MTGAPPAFSYCIVLARSLSERLNGQSGFNEMRSFASACARPCWPSRSAASISVRWEDVALGVAAAEDLSPVAHGHQQVYRLAIAPGAEGADRAHDGETHVAGHAGVGARPLRLRYRRPFQRVRRVVAPGRDVGHHRVHIVEGVEGVLRNRLVGRGQLSEAIARIDPAQVKAPEQRGGIEHLELHLRRLGPERRVVNLEHPVVAVVCRD